jgi:hypothetical protein
LASPKTLGRSPKARLVVTTVGFTEAGSARCSLRR